MLKKILAIYPRSFVLNKVHIVESAIRNIQQNLGYKIMHFTALKCCHLYRFIQTLHNRTITFHTAPHLLGEGEKCTKGIGVLCYSDLGNLRHLLCFINAEISYSCQMFEDKILKFCFAFHKN